VARGAGVRHATARALVCAGVAEIVGALGVPHNPFSALLVAQDGDGAAEPRRLYGAVAAHLHAMRPDTLIVFTTDHYNLFFELSVPIFAIGVADSTSGSSDYPILPHHDIAVDAVLAKQIQTSVVDDGFDLGMSQEFELDHTITAPLGVMIPRMDVAVVPLWISTSMRPIPSAQRCHALGTAIRAAVERSPLERRVAVVASGAFSFEVGGPRMSEDSHVGVPDPEWALRVTELLAAGDVEALLSETTPAQLAAAGNASGEILNWIAMLGTFDAGVPLFIEAQRAEAHAFAAWSAR
jgi:aromatic ring-opening dioxygenase catalytic subunit (LigB family)